jgi:hypothetical protein
MPDVDFILVNVPESSMEYKQIYDEFIQKFGASPKSVEVMKLSKLNFFN